MRQSLLSVQSLLPVLLLSALIVSSAGAQVVPDRCATYDYNQLLMNMHPGMARQVAAIEAHTQANLAGADGGNIYRIPVVFHVVWNQSSENLTTARLQSQIDVLNEDFRRTNADAVNTPAAFQPVAADSEIEFCLATVDPQGQPTTGITRTQTSVTSFSTNDNVKFNSSGGHNAWPASQYLNIWVCDLSGGVIGYATFPGAPASVDGVVLDYAYTGRFLGAFPPFNLGRSGSHEVGHWLNLRHMWGNGNGSCSQDDLVADTPNTDGPNFGCAAGSVSCGSVDMVQNYMDYSDDACMNLFTLGQKARMRALFTPGGFRTSLLTSPAACAGATPEYQLNQPSALALIDGLASTESTPAVSVKSPGQSGTIALASQTGIGPAYEVGFVATAAVPLSAGGLPTPGGQIININIAHPSLVFLSSGTNVANPQPWPGNFNLPYVAPGFCYSTSLQMLKVNAALADTYGLSGPVELQVVVAGPSLPAGPTGDDSNVTANLGGFPITFYGVSYTQMHVSSNGRVLFGGPDTDFSATIPEALTDNPFAGYWSDFDPTSGGLITLSSQCGQTRVDWSNVPYYNTTSYASFGVVFDQATGAVAIEGLAGVPGGAPSAFLGISRGNTGATNGGTTVFSPGGSATVGATPMIYDFCSGTCTLSSLGTGLDRILMVPAGGGYTWFGQ